MTGTAWERSLGRADKERDRQQRAAQIAEEHERQPLPHQETPAELGEVANALRYIGNVLAAGIVVWTIIWLISLAVSASQIRQATGR